MKQSKLFDGLNPEQAAAVGHEAGPLLIVAGAGTGKTTVITRRIAWLIEQGLCKPQEILALTFTEKAAGEMEERVDKLLPYGYLDLWISTFHAFGKRILEQHGLSVGLPINFRLLGETELWALVRKNLAVFELDYYQPLGNPSRFIHALIRHFSRAKDELIGPAEYLEYAKSVSLNHDSDVGLKKKKSHDEDEDEEEVAEDPARAAEIARAYAQYQKLLVENDALDYGDLIAYTHELFRKRPEVLARLRVKFKYILIDEFQDTNLAQYELIKLLVHPRDNITVVGDDDQSIYKFRGASVSNILRFREDFPRSAQVTLVKNYRSFQNLLDASYAFIKLNSPDRLEDKLSISKKLVAQRSGAGMLDFVVYADFHQEADGVAEKIEHLKKKDVDASWNDFAILVRANDTAEPFVEALERRGVPYMHLSRRGLYRKPVIVDVLSYFRLLDNYHEGQALYRVLQLPEFSYSGDDLALLVSWANRKSRSLYEALRQPELLSRLSAPGQKSAHKLLALIESHTLLARSRPVNELFVRIVADLGLAEKARVETSDEVQRLSFLDQFYRKIRDFALESDHKLLRDFMEEVEMELHAGSEGSLDFDPDTGPEALKIITVHSAKGLEFRHVFLPAMADKKFPGLSRGEPIELPEKLIRDILPSGDFHIQEERRLFYVAMTRARDGLYFSYARDYGGSTVRRPSVFLKDMGLVQEDARPTGRVEFTKMKERSRKKVVYPMPKSFSFTAISSFRKCPLEYKYAHILRVPRPGSGAISFGQTIHKTLELYLKEYQQALAAPQGDLFAGNASKAQAEFPPWKNMLKLYESSWVDDWFEDREQKEKYQKRGLAILKAVYDKLVESKPVPKYVEQTFKLGLGRHLLTGKIDRADATDRGLLIVDYKTGSAKPLAKVDREQLLIYQWAAQDFLHEKVAGLEYWYFGDSDVAAQHFLGTPEQLRKTQDELLETVEKIVEAVRGGDFEKFHKKHRGCEYE